MTMKLSRALQHTALLSVVTLFLFGCSDPQPSDSGEKSGANAPAGPTGTIRGVVRLMGKAPAPSADPIKQDQSTCGNSVSLPRIELGPVNGVKDTFVFLDGVPTDPNAKPAAHVSLLVDQKNCQYVPHAMTVPVGTELEITNSDSILHNVHGNIVGTEGLQTIFNIAQPIKGQHGKTPALDKPGIVSLTCEAGHPWMNAYVFVATNPYVAITKDDGGFVIPNVPVGKYQIKLWHEGVTLKQNNRTLQRYDYEDPYEETKEVVVTAAAETAVNFDVTLRPGKGN
jgi:plastocyanin